VPHVTITERGWRSRLGSRLLLFVVLAAFVTAQDPLANLREHSHSRTQTHSCAACHSALLSAAAAPAAITLPAVAFTGWFRPVAGQPIPGSATVIALSSRAPPAASSLHLG